MTIYNWTSLGFPAPATHSRVVGSKTGLLESSLTGAIQIIQRPTFWLVTASWNLWDSNYRNDVLAFLLSVEKTAHLVSIPYFGHVQRGAFGGTPLVAGGSQTGRTINIDGVSPSITNWIRRGDWIRFGGSSFQGYMAAEDSDSDGSGNVAVVLTQSVLSSPVNNEVATVSGMSASFITCRCIAVSEWTDQRTATTDRLTQITATFVQDVLRP